MTDTAGQPTRDEFVAFWEKHTSEMSSWRALVPHCIYVCGFALYALVVCLMPDAERFWLVLLAVAIAYIILVPYIWIRTSQARHARFIRCPHCGDWLGRDMSGAWHGPNPKWISIGRTGHCVNCEREILAGN